MGRNALSFVTEENEKEKLLVSANSRIALFYFLLIASSMQAIAAKVVPITRQNVGSSETRIISNTADNSSLTVPSSVPSTTNTSSVLPVKSLSERRFPDNQSKPLTIDTGHGRQNTEPAKIVHTIAAATAASPSNSKVAATASKGVPAVNQTVTGPSISASAVVSKPVAGTKAAGPEDDEDIHGRAPILRACWGKNWDEVKRLIDTGADITARDNVS